MSHTQHIKCFERDNRLSIEPIKDIAKLLRNDRILGEPTRLLIMILLYLNIRMKFTDLQKILGLTAGNLASHLKKLKESGYVNVRKTFLLELRTTTIVEITKNGARRLLEFMGSLKEILKLVHQETH